MIGWIQGLAEVLPAYRTKMVCGIRCSTSRNGKEIFPGSICDHAIHVCLKAVNKGYIDPKYRAVAEKAFKGLKSKLMVERQDGTLTLTRCCQVGGGRTSVSRWQLRILYR